jgi:hypothetical protein
MDFLMLLQILRPLECLFASRAPVRFQGDMDSKVAGDVVPLHHRDITMDPMTSQTQIAHRFPSHMVISQMSIQLFGVKVFEGASLPETCKDFVFH